MKLTWLHWWATTSVRTVIDVHDADAEWEDVGSSTLIPPRWVVRRILPTGITFLVGPPKGSKTTVEMALALTVMGVKHTVLPTNLQESDFADEGFVMMLQAEHAAGELKQMVEEGFGVGLPADGRMLTAKNAFQFRLDDPGAVKRLLAWLKHFQPRLFCIDPLVDFHALDEKDAGSMNRLLRPLQKWAKENDAALLVVHHTRKTGSDDPDRVLHAGDMRGSSAMFGLADGIIVLTPRGRAGVHFAVTIKRGEAWEETIKLGTWGNAATIRIDANATRVFEALKKLAAENADGGSPTIGDLATSLSASKSTVTASLKALVALGAVTEARQILEGASEKVAAAALKWGSSTGTK